MHSGFLMFAIMAYLMCEPKFRAKTLGKSGALALRDYRNTLECDYYDYYEQNTDK